MNSPTDARDSSFGSTRSSLIARARAHDTQAWEQLARLYAPLVYGWIRRAGYRAEDAADVAQEVFLRVHKGLADFDRKPNASFRGWLWTIARNETLRHRTRRATRQEAVGGTDAQQALARVPESPALQETSPEGADTLRLVHKAIELVRPRVDGHTWQAFWERTHSRRTAKDIGQELGMSEQAVYQATHRVLAMLREMLADD